MSSESTVKTTSDATPDAVGAAPRLLYCHCAFARVVPSETKDAVLAGLAEADVAFDAVPDLCQLAARRDPVLRRLAHGDRPLEIVACYPRAVRWLFHAADTPLPEDGVRIHNMRIESPEELLTQIGRPSSDEPTAQETEPLDTTEVSP